MQKQNLSIYEYILDVNFENLTNYKRNICEKKGNDTLIRAVSLHFERFVYVCGLSNENHLSKLNCVPIVRRYLKRIKAYFCTFFRRLGRSVRSAVSRSEAMGSIPTRDFPPWLRGRIVSPSKVGITQRLNMAKCLSPFALEPYKLSSN